MTPWAAALLLLVGCGEARDAEPAPIPRAAPAAPATPPAPDPAPHFAPATASALAAPDRIELLVLGERVEEPTEDAFDGRERLATFAVPTSAHRAIVEGLIEARQRADAAALCYEPHHGLLVHRGEATARLSICFHCAQLHDLDAEGRYLVIGGGSLRATLDRIIERETPYRFDEDRGSMGGWVTE